MAFKKEGFDKFILDNNVVGLKEEPFKLKSGRLSHWYANCRVLSDNLGMIDRTAQFVIDFLEDNGLKADYVYGVPAGVTKLATVINCKLGLKQGNVSQKIIIGREKPKEHGDPKDRYFIGKLEGGDKAVILEDVTTTGGSVISQLKFLREAKVDVIAVVALVNRIEKRDDGMSVAEYIKNEFNIPYFWLSDAERLLPLAVNQADLDESTVKKVQENLNLYSVRQINLRQGLK